MGRIVCRWTRMTWLRRLLIVLVACVLPWVYGFAALAASGSDADSSLFSAFQSRGASADIYEVSPPATIQQLRSRLQQNQPQVKILSPRPEQMLEDDTVTVRLQVKDLDIFQDADLGLGPHLHVFLDDQPYQALYDLTEPLIIDELKPGTHLLRVLAVYPWFESFKNDEAYAQTTFHVFTKTRDNQPTATQPLLTYNQPQDVYGSEPLMLDFNLSNLSGDQLELASDPTSFAGQVQVTINDTSFTVDGWKTLYLNGLSPGKNWIRLELLDRQGREIRNVYDNDVVRLIDLQPQGQDTFARLLRGELTLQETQGIIDPNYEPPKEEPVVPKEPTPVVEDKAVPTEQEVKPVDPPPQPIPQKSDIPAVVEPVTPADSEPVSSDETDVGSTESSEPFAAPTELDEPGTASDQAIDLPSFQALWGKIKPGGEQPEEALPEQNDPETVVEQPAIEGLPLDDSSGSLTDGGIEP